MDTTSLFPSDIVVSYTDEAVAIVKGAAWTNRAP